MRLSSRIEDIWLYMVLTAMQAPVTFPMPSRPACGKQSFLHGSTLKIEAVLLGCLDPETKTGRTTLQVGVVSGEQ